MTAVDPSRETPSASAAVYKGRLLLLSLAVLVLDQWTKWLVEVHLPRYAIEPVIPHFLNITHVENTGVAFGLFAAQGDAFRTTLLSAVGLCVLAALAWYYWRTPVREKPLLVALALVCGGAVGNLVDRIASGAVTDFIDVYVGTYHWHTFNIADSAISVGLVLLAWDAFRPSGGREPAGGDGEAER